MTLVVGVDVGFGRRRKAGGLCRTRDVRFLVSRASADEDGEQRDARRLPRRCDILAVDGPVVAPGFSAEAPRNVERMFSVGGFQNRCRPAATHTAGKNRELRQSTGDCLRELLANIGTSQELLRFPHVLPRAAVVESFPNAFLGVMVPEADYAKRAANGRRDRFSWALDRCRHNTSLRALAQRLEWPDAELWDALESAKKREEQAALVACATAACVAARRYVAIGDLRGGYFFLPPWDLWADWAKQALGENRERPELGGAEIWINGVPTIRQSRLPA